MPTPPRPSGDPPDTCGAGPAVDRHRILRRRQAPGLPWRRPDAPGQVPGRPSHPGPVPGLLGSVIETTPLHRPHRPGRGPRRHREHGGRGRSRDQGLGHHRADRPHRQPSASGPAAPAHATDSLGGRTPAGRTPSLRERHAMRPRALLLDFGGVITTDFYAAIRTFCASQGLAANAIEYVLATRPEVRARLVDAERGRITQHEFEETLGGALGIPGRGIIARIGAHLKPCQPVLDLVARARHQGFRTGVLSNSWGSGDYNVYDAYDLERHFDTVVISDQVGISKPDTAIYQLAADRLGVNPPECIFADDTAAYLAPAHDLGMAVVHFAEPETGIAEIVKRLGLSHPGT
ncbi:hypothetical protein C1I98_01475 [Spongiactinospora gelatinilytica]|uniref:HAD family phosphatase n=2 Tax=Spongiactinospora gelatinilytica TaxID=2666298 RepID=A0A2W2HMH9_9ACTN|nr:hypothetical protein C1I98_01475 [Spongiactinospora gelatinilytica]